MGFLNIPNVREQQKKVKVDKAKNNKERTGYLKTFETKASKYLLATTF